MSIPAPLMSVLMPSLNQAGFIEAAARSVLAQDYPALELVVADGGSTDGTLGRLESLLAEFGPGRLRWISEPDSGPANAVNKALGLAQGELVGWLNADDLYAPGAAAAAARHFATNPGTVLLYGEGEHIDACGRPLGRYPTRPPAAGLKAFHDGCYLCQPTAFLRREAFKTVGGLDESLKAAFDFELWLRIFRRFPDGIAQLDRVQAYSRLHSACITQTARRAVAAEAVRVLARHAGPPQPHWILTYFEELCADYPFAAAPADLRADLAELTGELAGCFDAQGLTTLAEAFGHDARLRLARPGAYAAVHPDGWAPPSLALRFAGLDPSFRAARLACVHAWPRFAPLTLAIKTSWGTETPVTIDQPGPFELDIPFPARGRGDKFAARVESQAWFVPREAEPDSTDSRRLAFKVEALQLCP